MGTPDLGYFQGHRLKTRDGWSCSLGGDMDKSNVPNWETVDFWDSGYFWARLSLGKNLALCKECFEGHGQCKG